MPVGYRLINIDKHETISFAYIDSGASLWELTNTVISSTVITYYLLRNIGNRVTVVNDCESQFNLFGSIVTWDDIHQYADMTNELIDNLIQEQILEEDGIIWIDKEENLYFRNLKKVI